MGKGSERRPGDEKEYRKNYETIFGKKCVKCHKKKSECECDSRERKDK